MPLASTPRIPPMTSQVPSVTNIGSLLSAGEKSAMCWYPAELFTKSRYAGPDNDNEDMSDGSSGVID